MQIAIPKNNVSIFCKECFSLFNTFTEFRKSKSAMIYIPNKIKNDRNAHTTSTSKNSGFICETTNNIPIPTEKPPSAMAKTNPFTNLVGFI